MLATRYEIFFVITTPIPPQAQAQNARDQALRQFVEQTVQEAVQEALQEFREEVLGYKKRILYLEQRLSDTTTATAVSDTAARRPRHSLPEPEKYSGSLRD